MGSSVEWINYLTRWATNGRPHDDHINCTGNCNCALCTWRITKQLYTVQRLQRTPTHRPLSLQIHCALRAGYLEWKTWSAVWLLDSLLANATQTSCPMHLVGHEVKETWSIRSTEQKKLREMCQLLTTAVIWERCTNGQRRITYAIKTSTSIWRVAICTCIFWRNNSTQMLS